MIKIIFNTKLLSAVCLILAIGLVTSCKKDSNVDSGIVQLKSFGPSGAQHGDTLRFIGNNLNRVTEIDMVGAVVPASAFISQGPELILIIIPQAAEEGFVTLKIPEGNIVSQTKINFDVVVTVSSITKQARPGDNITIKGQFMNWVKEVKFAKDIAETSFVSKSLTELVVKVPINARSGTLFITSRGTKPLTFETDSALVVTLPAVTGFSPNPIVREANLTITGTNLDLAMGVLFKGITVPITTFVSQSATQIVVKVPTVANRGKITLVAHSGITTESNASLLFVGDLPDLAPLAYAFYTDALQNPWQNWGWSTTIDFANTENVRDGAASIKVNYTGQWGALKFANGSVSTASYSEIAFSIFGTPGTNGQKINVTPSGGSTYTVTIEEGKWVEYKLTKAQLGNPATITDLTFQNQAWSGIVYVDQVGLR
jgi:IPT/TIG domain